MKFVNVRCVVMTIALMLPGVTLADQGGIPNENAFKNGIPTASAVNNGKSAKFSVPEMDGAILPLSLGLVVTLVAWRRERNKK